MAERRTSFTEADIVLARVLHEDGALMTLEVIKDDERKLRIEDGDRFETLIFTAGKPWEREAV